ncbi:hypothetical protein HZS_6285 [Henneguya salminicola]|nr:hypothetical protein HZS_6285 [Henneguya salminicola]
MAEQGIALIKSEYKLRGKKERTDIIEELNPTKRKAIEKPSIQNKVCLHLLRENICNKGDECEYSHDIDSYLETKPANLNGKCINMINYNACPFGITCRFSHEIKDLNIKSCSNYNLTLSNTADAEFLKTLRKNEYKYRGEDSTDTFTRIDPDLSNKTIDFKGKLYLAPLTTVGNLPFRRICKKYGADITCSEMAVSSNLLQGKMGEWALLKRHTSEDIFGVQISGSNCNLISKAVELISSHTNVDFIDLNMGCPIDLFFNKGSGCALMKNPNKVVKIVKSMITISKLPVTVKMRTGIKDGVNLAHKLIPVLVNAGVSGITLHGRSRAQRYTKLADWAYISECAKISSVPIIGNGDIMSHQEMMEHMTSDITGIMIGRAALIKPWIFTEIKEKRLWDISSRERLDIVKTFVNHGLEHWGTDTKGVERTRLFLLEWLSFQCRYVPVGILEHPPQRINQRPESFVGRDDLETLLSSKYVQDWLKISSMFLGSPSDDFKFNPKHKSTSYG